MNALIPCMKNDEIILKKVNFLTKDEALKNEILTEI